MIFVTQLCGMRVNVFGLGTISWTQLKSRLPESQNAQISENPLQFPILHRGTRRALLSRFPFGVFFRVKYQTIVVLAVMHASRNPVRWRDRT